MVDVKRSFVYAATLALLVAFGPSLGVFPEAARGNRIPLGLPSLPEAASTTSDQAGLGKKLFFDRRLSFNETMSCGMCHIEGQGYTSNQTATSVGSEGKRHRRNAPSLFNVAYEKQLFRDGRETSLETQVWSPLLSKEEMNAPSVGYVINKIGSLVDYRQLFAASYGERGVSMESVGRAIASFERTLLLANSRFDRWRYADAFDALTAQERHGYQLFVGKAGCAACHSIGADAALFTDHSFHSNGIGYANTMGSGTTNIFVRLAEGETATLTSSDMHNLSDPRPNDLGRFEITLDPKDRWAFKTPSLRNIALTAPYMHDGSLATLDDVVAFYDLGGIDNPTKNKLFRPLHLSGDERRALVAFLRSLTGVPD